MNTHVEQVGGTHYKADYQHWDWVDDTQLPYLEACATKYLARWRQKGGIQDLKKARSYLLKREAQPYSLPAGLARYPRPEERERFLREAKVPEREASIIRVIDTWQTGRLPIELLEELIRDAEESRV